MTTVTEQTTQRLNFFESLYSKDTGYICIATIARPYKRDLFKERYFEWPAEKTEMLDYIEGVIPGHNVYFGVNVFSVAKRLGINTIPQNLLWADLDSCRPDQLEVPPQVVIESSPRRYHGIWRLDQKIDPELASHYSKRIAYHYQNLGVDTGGHDLTQLLRVPNTFNYKYELVDAPTVNLLTNSTIKLPVALFEKIPLPPDTSEIPDVDMPNPAALPDPRSIIYAYRDKLDEYPGFARCYSDEPADDWSKQLWRLILTCAEVGMTTDEMFAVARSSKCNKYARDKRPESHLWREILKAHTNHQALRVAFTDDRILRMPQLLTAKELSKTGKSIIADYVGWGSATTDATEEYHELCCAILLSILMASSIRIPTNWGTLVPNLWGLILGDSTLTRKTTAMNMVMDFVAEIDSELVVATDGSAEGILSSLSTRPKMVSVFYRDEVTGLLDAMQRKEYMSGLPETMANLYDVPKFMTRRLRKESITITEPVFVFFAGGIRDKTYFLLEEQYFTSGFIPRFLVVAGYTDLNRVRNTGRPEAVDLSRREELRARFATLYATYSQSQIQVQAAGQMMSLNREVTAELSDKAWTRAAEMENLLMETANNVPEKDKALPCFNRMFISMLKLATLLAAARQEPDAEDIIHVQLSDLLESASYIQKWGVHTVELIRKSGQPTDEQKILSIYRTIERHPGIQRSRVMQYHHLNARQMSEIQETLKQRDMVVVKQNGKAHEYYPIGR